MRKITAFLIILFVGIIPLFVTSAQTTEAELYARADSLIRNILPNVGTLTNGTIVVLSQTNDSALGCSLVAGYNLGYPVTPYQIRMTYDSAPQNPMTVILSSDPYVYALCDLRLLSAQYAVNTPSNWSSGSLNCSASAFLGRVAPIYTEPNTASTYITDLSAASFVPVVGRTADTSWYALDLAGRIVWASINHVQLSGADCYRIPVNTQYQNVVYEPPANSVNVSSPSVTPTCQLYAIDARIRWSPGLSQPETGERVRSGDVYTVVGVSNDADWRQVVMKNGELGWVHRSVSTLQGAGCSALPITSESVTVPLASACPFAYAGYLAPRLFVGGQAQVIVQEGVTIRQSPTPDSGLVANAARGTVYNVVGGPLCGTGVIWWQISYRQDNGTYLYPWIPESDVNRSTSHYLTPVTGLRATRFAEIAPSNALEIGKVEAGGRVVDIAFAPDGSRFAIANGADNAVRFWGSSNGERTGESLNHDALARMSFVDFKADGSLIATGDYLGVLNIWQGGAIIRTVQAQLQPFFPIDFAINPDWSLVAISGCLDGDLASGGCRLGGVQIFDLNTGAKRADYYGQLASVRAVLFLGNNRLISAADDNTVWVWDVATGTFAPLAMTTQAITDLALTQDANTFAIAHCASFGDNNGVRVCNNARVSLYDSASLAFKTDITGPRDLIIAVSFNPSGSLIALASLDNTVTLYQTTDGKLVETYIGYIYGATSVAFSPDGSLLATGDNAGIMTLLRVPVQ
ncbi:MAG: hypothetical protein CUN52_05515 [Phototrophicales bacterium]|nr:MAG: hypothetical protein CUN52_05515 [Phototrophicales bacterium]